MASSVFHEYRGRHCDKGTIRLGKRVRAHRRSKITVFSNGLLEIGSNATLNNGVTITCMDKIVIGAYAQIGPDTKIYDHDHDFCVPGGIMAEKFKISPVGIGDNSWIGCNVDILRRITIGKTAL